MEVKDIIEKTKDDLLLYATGDLCVERQNSESIFSHVAPILNQADVVFGQLETNISDKGSLQVHAGARAPGWTKRAKLDTISAYKFAGFDVLSFASNHCLDWGNEALFDTIKTIKRNAIEIVGVGENIEEARKPAILEREGTKIAILAYNSILPQGYAAGPNKPGCAPIHIYTSYEPIDWQPGTPFVEVRTAAYREDLEAMAADVKKAKSRADVVIVSMHWGIHFAPSLLADYQREVGHVAIDADADLIIGHHAHLLKGVEVYKGKCIFYSLGNFAFDSPVAPKLHDPRSKRMARLYGYELDPEYPTYGFPPDSRKTVLAKCVINDKEIKKISLLTAMINKQGQPVILKHSDQRSVDVFDYLSWVCTDQRLATSLHFEGDEIVIAI